MAILQGDIKLLASKVMSDDPEGGGGPTGTVIRDGASNAVFDDIAEPARAGGAVNIRQLFLAVHTSNRDVYMGANIIVAEPPADPNVSITIARTTMFARRTAIAEAIADYLIRGPVWGGFLFENHVARMGRIQIFQRPNSPMPPINHTLALVSGAGTPNEVVQYVRTTRVESEIRMFYDPDKGADYPAMIVSCDLTDRLRTAFVGSPPSRSFAAAAGATVIRDSTVANASNFFGVVPLSAAASMTDSVVKVSSIYTQIVPSSRTETIALDQKPASQRSFVLAEAPRRIEVGLTPHTMRVRVGQENRSFSWVQILKPNPAPNTIVVSFRALGQWYTLQDNGLGELTGSGVGTVNYATGSIAVTLPSLPDAASSLIYSWGECTAYTDRKGQAGFRAPEFAYEVGHQALKPASVKVRWKSGGLDKLLTDDGVGNLTGDGTGQVNYAAGRVFVRPSAMIDAGGEFNTEYAYSTLVTQNVAIPALDAGGFATIALDESPFPRSVTVKWVTVRSVSETSGSSEIVAKQGTGVETTTVFVPQTLYGITPSTTDLMAGGTVTFKLRLLASAPAGVYTYSILTSGGVSASSFLTNSLTGTFTAAAGSNGEVTASFTLDVAPGAGYGTFFINVFDPALSRIASSSSVNIAPFPANLTDIPANMPQPAIKVRNPINSGGQVQAGTGLSLVAGMYEGGLGAAGNRLYVAVFASKSAQYGWYYDPPADTGQVWSEAELTAKSKVMQSLNGSSLAYALWGGGAPINQNILGG